MIGRSFRRDQADKDNTGDQPVGFDAYDLRLGDLMRGERATLGKSLLDVQRELKIKAGYIAAIENADPSAFDTPGFIAGYVRSYARYLKMDPEWAFETFCAESGFETTHGMQAGGTAKAPKDDTPLKGDPDIFAAPATPFVPGNDAVFSGIEPGAVGSVLVLIALIGGLGYGGFAVLQEVQRVQFAPVEQTPTVLSDLEIDPLAGNAGRTEALTAQAPVGTGFDTPPAEALDRLYRPEALDVPVMVPRDGPIATISPFGATDPIADVQPTARVADLVVPDVVTQTLAGVEPVVEPGRVQVTATPQPGVQLVAVRPAWVRVRSANGAVIFEKTMQPGDTFDVPQTEDPATLRIGESGAVYFRIAGEHYGPVGPAGQVTSNLALSIGNLTGSYQVADINGDSDLREVVNVAEVQR